MMRQASPGASPAPPAASPTPTLTAAQLAALADLRAVLLPQIDEYERELWAYRQEHCPAIGITPTPLNHCAQTPMLTVADRYPEFRAYVGWWQWRENFCQTYPDGSVSCTGRAVYPHPALMREAIYLDAYLAECVRGTP